ncbi:MAG: hypothetical protein KIT84_26520 [Labilithrix sp.]|nr:hypothetical protein [Labilithrix sp.]MCW5814608.1 hypothetical protein [Labilithrix sp.]
MATSDESGEWTVAPGEESDRMDPDRARVRAEVADRIARFLERDPVELSDDEGQEIVDAWRAFSVALMNSYSRFVPDAAWLTRVLLIMQREDKDGILADGDVDNRDLSNAADVAAAALSRLSGEEHVTSESLARMAKEIDPEIDPNVARRVLIVQNVQRALGRVTADRRREEIAKELRRQLGAIDPRLRLDENVARVLVRLYARANGARKLAANWSWRSGLEGAPRDGETLASDAPARVVERFGDPDKKREKNRRARSRASDDTEDS